MSASLRFLFDVGSSSVRCSAVASPAQDEPHTALHASRIALHQSEDGSFPAGVVMDACDAALQQALSAPAVQHAAAAAAVIDVAFSTFAMNALLVDAATLRPLTDIFSYAARSAAVHARTALLRQHVAEHDVAYYDRVGAPVHAAYLPSQWPDDPPAGALTTIASLCIARWTGIPLDSVGISLSESAWMGVCDLRAMSLDHRLRPSDAAQLPTVFALCAPLEPHHVPSTSPLATLGVGRRLRLWRGLGDGAAATFGCAGTGQDGAMTCTIGTSAAIRAFVRRDDFVARTCDATAAACAAAQRPVNVDLCSCPACGKMRLSWTGLWAYGIDEQRVLVGGALTDGGSLITTLSSQFKQDCTILRDSYSHLAAACGAGGDGDASLAGAHAPCPLICMPSLSGERATGWHDAATGAFVGVTHLTTAQDYAAAAMEAVAYRLRAILHRLRALLQDDRRPVVLNGGALDHAPAWVAILANVLDTPLEWMSSSSGTEAVAVETTTLGLNVMIDAATGRSSPAAAVGRPIIPVPAVAARYTAGYLQHCRAYAALSTLWS